jgi:branched-subunit amino acid transport protein
MVSVLCADCNDYLVCHERDVTKTLQYVSICMMTALCFLGFTMFQGHHQLLSSYPLYS